MYRGKKKSNSEKMRLRDRSDVDVIQGDDSGL